MQKHFNYSSDLIAGHGTYRLALFPTRWPSDSYSAAEPAQELRGCTEMTGGGSGP